MGFPPPQDKIWALLIALAPILLAAFGPRRRRRPFVFAIPVFVLAGTLFYAWRNREALAGEADLRRRLLARGAPVEADLVYRTVGEQGEVRWAHFGYDYLDAAGARHESETIERVTEEDLAPLLDRTLPFDQAVGRLTALPARCDPGNPGMARLACNLKTERWDRLVGDADRAFLPISGIGGVATLLIWGWLIRRAKSPVADPPNSA